MDYTEVKKQLGEGWKLHRSKNNDKAVQVFKQLVSQLEANTNSTQDLMHLLDANYGLGLAQRAIGDRDAAVKAFEAALALAERGYSGHLHEGHSNIKTTDDDRFLMLKRMVTQRLAEMK